MATGWYHKIRGAWAALMSWQRQRQRLANGLDEIELSRRQSNWEKVVDGYRAYLGRHPKDFGIRVRLIRALDSAGRLEEAEASIAESLKMRPDKTGLRKIAADIQSARTKSIPVADFDRFRKSTEIPEPPALTVRVDEVTVLIDARHSTSQMVELTLNSLLLSGISAKPSVQWSDDEGADARSIHDTSASTGFVLTVDAGVTLAPQALGWLVHAIVTTGAVAAYGDDDQAARHEAGTAWSNPAFHVAPHPLDLATAPRIPAAVLFLNKVPLEPVAGEQGGRQRRDWLMRAFDLGTVAHVPLLLATDWLPRETNPTECDAISNAVPRGRILAIIPTRDEGVTLAAMIESLETRAVQRSQLEILVVDNGSRDAATLELLEALSRGGRIRVLTVDEPFNWSRLNNLGAEGSDAEILLFANNDMQMIAEGWDDRLRSRLLQPGVGIVGARLLYPGGLLQHAGMTLGALDGKPVHEGLGADSAVGGPLDRWRRARPAAAVTGAFMAVRREIFEQAGGFNAVDFKVGCNDIDFCLRVRERGWSVLYAPDLELIHLESYSRGHDDSEERQRRAQGELEALFRFWGEAAANDPGRNPHWVNHHTLLYFGLRQPDIAQVEAWIIRSVDGWRVARRGAQEGFMTPTAR